MALTAVKATGYAFRLVGLELTGRGIAREGYRVRSGDFKIGKVTSGALSPTLEKPIALAKVRLEYAKVGTKVQVEIRDKLVDAVVVKRPFYQNEALKA